MLLMFGRHSTVSTIYTIYLQMSYKTTLSKGHLSYQARYQIHNTTPLIRPLSPKGHLSYKTILFCRYSFTGLAVMLVLMSVWTFVTVVILYALISSKGYNCILSYVCLTSFIT